MARGYIDPNFPNPMGPGDATIVIYGYTPNFVLCIIGVVLFTILFLLHTWQIIKYKFWTFIPVSVACVMEIIGYVCRTLSSRKDPYRVAFFVAQYFCITCAPVFISASIYVFLSELAIWAGSAGFAIKSLRRVSLTPKRILWTFVSADVACTLLQITGAALIGSKTSQRKDPTQANNILIAGLAVQTFAFLIFLVLMFVFVFSCAKEARTSPELSLSWKTKRIAVIGVIAAALLVFLRTVFRLAESSDGVFGYLSSHEVFFGALEFAPIVIGLIFMAIWHPGRYFPKQQISNKQYGS